jgi:hypothetical protein
MTAPVDLGNMSESGDDVEVGNREVERSEEYGVKYVQSL